MKSEVIGAIQWLEVEAHLLALEESCDEMSALFLFLALLIEHCERVAEVELEKTHQHPSVQTQFSPRLLECYDQLFAQKSAKLLAPFSLYNQLHHSSSHNLEGLSFTDEHFVVMSRLSSGELSRGLRCVCAGGELSLH